MADIAFGIVGTIGVALQGAIATHAFLSSIKGAPRSLESLAAHIKTLQPILRNLEHRLSHVPLVERRRIIEHIEILEHAVNGCRHHMSDLDTEIHRYVGIESGSRFRRWGGRSIGRRARFALRKSQVLDLQRDLFASISILHLGVSMLNG